MSFGFGVGDFIEVFKLTYGTITALKDAPDDYAGFKQELSSLNTALGLVAANSSIYDPILAQLPDNTKDGLRSVLQSCTAGLSGLQEVILDCTPPRKKGEATMRDKLKYVVRKYRKNLDGARKRTVIHTNSLNMILIGISHQIMAQQEKLYMAKFQELFNISSGLASTQAGPSTTIPTSFSAGPTSGIMTTQNVAATNTTAPKVAVSSISALVQSTGTADNHTPTMQNSSNSGLAARTAQTPTSKIPDATSSPATAQSDSTIHAQHPIPVSTDLSHERYTHTHLTLPWDFTDMNDREWFDLDDEYAEWRQLAVAILTSHLPLEQDPSSAQRETVCKPYLEALSRTMNPKIDLDLLDTTSSWDPLTKTWQHCLSCTLALCATHFMTKDVSPEDMCAIIATHQKSKFHRFARRKRRTSNDFRRPTRPHSVSTMSSTSTPDRDTRVYRDGMLVPRWEPTERIQVDETRVRVEQARFGRPGPYAFAPEQVDDTSGDIGEKLDNLFSLDNLPRVEPMLMTEAEQAKILEQYGDASA